jgi:hypothetical protein
MTNNMEYLRYPPKMNDMMPTARPDTAFSMVAVRLFLVVVLLLCRGGVVAVFLLEVKKPH